MQRLAQREEAPEPSWVSRELRRVYGLFWWITEAIVMGKVSSLDTWRLLRSESIEGKLRV